MKYLAKAITAAALVTTMAGAATVVTVNGNAITDQEVNGVLMEGTQGRFNQLPQEKQDELRKRIVDGMITQQLIYEDAEKTGVLKTKTFQEEYDLVIEKVKVQLAAKVWEQEQFEKVTIPEKEVKAYYEQNKEEFVEPEQVHARHILVKSEAEANKIIDQLKGLKGAALRDKFIELAKTESTGPSGPKGGDLGFFPRGQMVPEFNDAVFAMNIETISTTPVKSQFGYHIIFLEEKKPGKMASFDEVKGFIEQRLKLEKFKEIVEAKISALKASAKIDYAK